MRWSGIVAACCAALTLTPPSFASAPSALPPYTPAYEPTTVDERGMWMEADERERLLRDSPLRIREGGLERYVREVLCREVGDDRCKGVRVYVMEIPAFNASMMANGCMEVWSGLLLRARSEAELAAVLGHEFGHFELRHTLMGFKAKRSATDVMAWVDVLGGITNRDMSSANVSLVGSLYRFDRAQETEADLLGFKYMAASGYPAKAASEIWQQRMAEDDATAVGRGLKPRRNYTSGFFDTHPTDLKRAEYLAKAAAALPADGDARVEQYRAAIAPYLSRMLAAQIKMNDFGGTDFILNSLASSGGWSGELLFARAELYRTRGNPRDLQMASLWYRDAKAAGYVAPELDRNLGLALLRNGQTEDARKSLGAYLVARPDAPDAKMIQALLAN